MTTRTDWPRPRDDEDSMRVFFSIFDDVVPLWDLDGEETVAIPVETMRQVVGR